MNMNTALSYNTSEPLWNKRTSSETTSEPSRSRRCSTETIFSIQDRETDLLRDTSDTEWYDSDGRRHVEYEPATEPEEDGPLAGDTTDNSDNEIISTKVIEVVVRDDGDLELADSEQTASGDSDSEMDFHDYWNCAQCRAQNNNPLYRYCEKCFKVRKNFFPPRPKPKHKPETRVDSETIPRTLSQDSGVESAINSQELSQETGQARGRDLADGPPLATDSESRLSERVILSRNLKRRAESLDRNGKRSRAGYSRSESDSQSEPERKAGVAPLVKMTSDPALTVAAQGAGAGAADGDGLCIMCCAAPKSGVFVHGRIAHICCCYRCARRVWARAGRCPVCNCKVSNVLRAVVM